MLLFAQSDNNVILGLLGTMLFFIIFTVYIMYNGEAKDQREFWHMGICYSTLKSHRIFGVMGERVDRNGRWLMWCKSLWRTHEQGVAKKCYFFVLHVDELSVAKIKPLRIEEAKAFINNNATDAIAAGKLIKEWFGLNIFGESNNI